MINREYNHRKCKKDNPGAEPQDYQEYNHKKFGGKK